MSITEMENHFLDSKTTVFTKVKPYFNKNVIFFVYAWLFKYDNMKVLL